MGKVLRKVLPYILALLVIGACLGLAMLLSPILPGQSLLFFVAGVVLCSLFDGLPTGLFAALTAAICHSYFFQLPRYELAIESSQDIFELLIFGLLACTLNWFSVSIINSKKRAVDALNNEIATSQFKDRVLAVVAHDLRNPLTSIQMNAQMIGLHENRRQIKDHVRQILRSAARMNNLICDLLDADRIKSQHLRVNLQVESVNSLMQETIELLAPLAKEKGIGLELNVEGHRFVRCDRNRIIQVFSNLIGNAIKFSPNHSTVSVSAQLRDTKVEFTVSDTGPGMAPEDLPHIFEMFWQRPDKTNTGVGLGLAIARSMVEQHGGHIYVSSKLGHGTRFMFTLPAVEASAAVPLRAAG